LDGTNVEIHPFVLILGVSPLLTPLNVTKEGRGASPSDAHTDSCWVGKKSGGDRSEKRPQAPPASTGSTARSILLGKWNRNRTDYGRARNLVPLPTLLNLLEAV